MRTISIEIPALVFYNGIPCRKRLQTPLYRMYGTSASASSFQPVPILPPAAEKRQKKTGTPRKEPLYERRSCKKRRANIFPKIKDSDHSEKSEPCFIFIQKFIGTHIDLMVNAIFHSSTQHFHRRTDTFCQISSRSAGENGPFLFFAVQDRYTAGAAVKGRNCTSESERG